MVIKLDNVQKVYEMGSETVNALKGINMNIKKGDFVAIMGPSGSGKSTMMNLVGCLDIPSYGSIYLDEKDISHLTESELASVRGRKIGFIFQKFNLIPTLTALENVMLPLMFQKVDLETRKKNAIELLKMVNLENRMNHKPNELSGGEQQRVAIARALSVDPDVILADEPTGNLDSKRGSEVMKFLTQLNKQGKTIIIVTHDQEIAKYARRTYNLRDGEIKNVS